MTKSRSLRHVTTTQVRLVTGLVVGAYVTLHLINHALGLISVRAMETARPYFMAPWQTLPGQFALYGSLTVHAYLGLWAFARRRQYRLPMWEVAQIVVGLAIPYLLVLHIVATRGTRILTHIDINYIYEIANLWVDPLSRTRQTILVLLVWLHFVMGLHFWLRLRPWYASALPLVMLGYVLVPLAGLAGFAEVGMLISEHARADPSWYAEITHRGIPANAHNKAIRANLKQYAGYAWLGLVALVFIAAQIRNLLERKKTFVVTYPNDRVRASIGMSILEVSRMARRPHVSVCGGRGRCTTCRVRISDCDGTLPEPSALEARALARIGAPPGLRLACQTRPNCDLRVQPLLHPTISTRGVRGGTEFGQEREITVLFLDIRGSTTLAESRMPFDVVFIVNQLLAEMADAVDSVGGYYSNFTGDGLMALFGLRDVPDHGAHAGLVCAVDMLDRLVAVNHRLAEHLDHPLRVGIGVHTGTAIVGRMGPPRAPLLTALGDCVNTCARLQELCKETERPLVVSRSSLVAALKTAPQIEWQQAVVRGRTEPVAAAAMDGEMLRNLLGPGAPVALNALETAQPR